jgi:hypothetical protein
MMRVFEDRATKDCLKLQNGVFNWYYSTNGARTVTTKKMQ